METVNGNQRDSFSSMAGLGCYFGLLFSLLVTPLPTKALKVIIVAAAMLIVMCAIVCILVLFVSSSKLGWVQQNSVTKHCCFHLFIYALTGLLFIGRCGTSFRHSFLYLQAASGIYVLCIDHTITAVAKSFCAVALPSDRQMENYRIVARIDN